VSANIYIVTIILNTVGKYFDGNWNYYYLQNVRDWFDSWFLAVGRTGKGEPLELGSEGDHREGLPHAETFLSIDEQRVRLDLDVVFQSGLVSQQVLVSMLSIS